MVRWRTAIPGFEAHTFTYDGDYDALHIGDGWGVAYASLRLRTLDMRSGHERASVRLGNQCRTVAWRDRDSPLLAATDTKLFLLDRTTLAEQKRWDRRVPRYTDQILWRDDVALLANWHAPSVAFFDLETGRARRLKLGGEHTLFPLAESHEVLVASRTARVLWRVPWGGGKPTRVAELPEYADVAFDGRRTLWLSLGRRDRPPTSGLAALEIDRPSVPARTSSLEFEFWQLACTDGALWVLEIEPPGTQPGLLRPRAAKIHVLATPTLERLGAIAAPAGHTIRTMLPEAGAALASPIPPDPDRPSPIACVES